ncbi:type I-F CRISPR-associated protein Csy2 [Castellaniella sp.]|uniref:type I-F CRISPR-associated protein Csy2 n=1 Tax=Castellaniella sp. TaxID=1955812 RepID=UPI002B0033A3|nr:type I-F CRISPR-associated protein Csy2 [Castellaniella sp.]
MSQKNIDPDGLLILPRLRIQNANAISSPLTHGFPSMTAFLGFMWALGRKLAAAGIPLKPEKIGVICHRHQEQVADGYVKTFHLTRNPLGKDGSTAAIVEEGRIHLEVTLVLQVSAIMQPDEGHVLFQSDQAPLGRMAWDIRDLVGLMRIAGGAVLPPKPAPGIRVAPELLAWPDDADGRSRTFRRLRRGWLPGFALVSRDDLLKQRLRQLQQQDPQATTLDAWLDLSRFNYRSRKESKGGKDQIIWAHDRPAGAGWIVPIPVGYGALSDLHEGGQVAHARDSNTPFRFVESVYSMGQWISPHRLQNVRELLWWGECQEGGVYRCCNAYVPPLPMDGESQELLSDPPMEAEAV